MKITLEKMRETLKKTKIKKTQKEKKRSMVLKKLMQGKNR